MILLQSIENLAGETPEVRSDKSKPKEERENGEETEEREKREDGNVPKMSSKES